MKKFAIGLIVGILIAVSTSIYADEFESMIGKKVDTTYPLIIDGQRNSKDVISIDGTSYVPTRTAGELFGYSVDFDETEGVLMNKKFENLPVFEQELKKQPQYNYDTDLELSKYDQLVSFVFIGDEQYTTASPLFAKNAIWDGTTLEIMYKDKVITGSQENNFENGDSTFIVDGQFYIKLSSLGLKAMIIEGVVWIVELL